jgi:MoaA/NifB/PqqE/SkfB family radical SAM enzyme
MLKQKIWVWIDPTNFCNLACKLCYTKSGHGKDYLSIEDFQIIVDKLTNSMNIEVEMLHLNWKGEPFLNTRILDFIKYLNEIQVKFPVHIHTNGTILSKKLIESLCYLEFDIDFTMFFSLDGGSKELHEVNRGVDTFDKTIENLNFILGLPKSFKVGIYEIIIEDSNNSIYNVVKGKIDYHRRVYPIYPDVEEVNFFKKINISNKNLVNIENLDNFTVPEGACLFAGNTIAISPLGMVSVCLISNSREGYLGNIFTQSLEDIVLNANNFKKKLILEGRKNLSHCQYCMKPAVNF